MTENTQSAFQKAGFDIRLEAPQNYAGAYLQIVSEDDKVSSDYFDISLFKRKESSKSKKFKFGTSAKSTNENEVEIEVNFNDVPPGKFCYLLCIYDGNGNISQPVEVCVEVEAWGGNANMVANWELYRSEYTYDGETDVEEIGVEFCEPYSFYCSATQESREIENGYCETITLSDLVLNADGTYTYNSEDTGQIVNYDASNENDCEVVFEDDNDTYYSAGNWAYDEEEQKFTLVEFEWKEDDYPLEIEEDGYLIFDGSISFEGNTFIISEEETYNGELETFKGYFRRK